MFKVIVKDEFVDLLMDLPIKYLGIITDSFLSISQVDEIDEDVDFIKDLMEQMKNQELE